MQKTSRAIAEAVRTTRLSALSTLCAGYHELSLRHDDSYQLCPALSRIASCYRTWAPRLDNVEPCGDTARPHLLLSKAIAAVLHRRKSKTIFLIFKTCFRVFQNSR